MKSMESGNISTMGQLVKSVYIDISGMSEYSRFQRMYANDRIAFVYDCLPDLGNTLAPYQEEILGYFDSGYSKVAVRGPHGLGKTALAAVLVHHSVLTSEADAKVPTTASAWRQLEKFLWPEIRKMARLLQWSSIGRAAYDRRTEMLTMSIKLNDGLVEAFAVASDDHNTIEGAHAVNMFYVLDEAKAIPRPTWDAIEGAFSNAGAKVLGETNVGEYGVGELGVFVRDRGMDVNLPSSDIVSSSVENAMVDQSGVYGKNGQGNNGSKRGSEYSNEEPSVISGDGQEGGVYNEDTDVSESVSDKQMEEILSSNKRSDMHKEEILPPRIPLSHTQKSSAAVRMSSPSHSSVVSNRSASSTREVRSAGIVSTVYEARALAISTPGVPSGQFYDIHMRKPGFEDWLSRHVTIDEAIDAGRVSGLWVAQRVKQWGETSSVYQNRVLGEFADNTEEGVIPLSWIVRAQNKWKEWKSSGMRAVHGKKTLGVDVARAGDDKTVIAVRDGSLIRNLHVFSKLPTTATTGHVKVRSEGRYIQIETDGGLGAAVYDNLREKSVPLLRPITVGGSTHFRDKSKQLRFDDVRSAMWWNMRELLDPDNGEELMLPPVEELKIDLSSPSWEMISDGVVKVEAKKSIRARIGRSTDYGDACCLAFWNTGSGGGVVV